MKTSSQFDRGRRSGAAKREKVEIITSAFIENIKRKVLYKKK